MPCQVASWTHDTRPGRMTTKPSRRATGLHDAGLCHDAGHHAFKSEFSEHLPSFVTHDENQGQDNMRQFNLAAILVIAASLASTDLLADTADGNESDYEVGMIYSGKTNSQGLLQLPVFSPEDLKQLPSHDSDDNTIHAPARGVEYFQVRAVSSSYIGGWWELIEASQFSTVYDHGGSQLQVAVLQYVYGNGGASLNGAQGINYLTEYLCGSRSNLHYCSTGETVTGFMQYYSFNGAQGGSFSAFTNSIAYPWGQRTDFINIQ